MCGLLTDYLNVVFLGIFTHQRPATAPKHCKVTEFGLAGSAASGQELPSVYKAVKSPVRQQTGWSLSQGRNPRSLSLEQLRSEAGSVQHHHMAPVPTTRPAGPGPESV